MISRLEETREKIYFLAVKNSLSRISTIEASKGAIFSVLFKGGGHSCLQELIRVNGGAGVWWTNETTTDGQGSSEITEGQSWRAVKKVNTNKQTRYLHRALLFSLSLLQAEWQYSASPSYATDRLARSHQANFLNLYRIKRRENSQNPFSYTNSAVLSVWYEVHRRRCFRPL